MGVEFGREDGAPDIRYSAHQIIPCNGYLQRFQFETHLPLSLA